MDMFSFYFSIIISTQDFINDQIAYKVNFTMQNDLYTAAKITSFHHIDIFRASNEQEIRKAFSYINVLQQPIY